MPPASTSVKTKTITGVKIGIATGFLALSTAFAGLAATTSTPAAGLKPDLYITSISMNADTSSISAAELNKVTIGYRNNGEATVDKPFTFQIQFSPAIPDATIDQVTSVVNGVAVTTTVSKTKNGIFQIVLSEGDTTANTLGVAGLNQYQLDPYETGTIQLFFTPFKASTTFKEFKITGSLDVKKVIAESNEKNNVKKVTIPKAKVKIVLEKITCLDSETVSSTAKLPSGILGNDITVFGASTLTYGKKQTTKPDTCTTNKTITEYFCATDGSKIENATKNCTTELAPPAGQEAVCVNGACKIQPLSVTSCTETDKFMNEKIKGTTKKTYSDGSTKILEDTCTSETFLQQEGCGGSSGVSCSYKYGPASKCVDGACVDPIVTNCEDTDPGDDFAIKGTTVITYEGGQTVTLEDSCTSVEFLKQYNCSNKLNPVQKKCSLYNCKVGVCS